VKHAAGPAGTLHVIRLEPGEDVRSVLVEWATDQGIEAASIVSGVGSLTQANIRYANRDDGAMTVGDLEVCSISGTLSKHGLHLHLSIADNEGRMLGGHMLNGCLVRTTMELVIQEINGVHMLRSKDPVTGYEELDPQS
jgi:uncharacterized protein